MYNNIMIQKLMLIDALPLPKEITNIIKIDIKYNTLQKIYQKNMNDVNRHFLYYCWLNKKLCKKGDPQTLIKTVKEFDYYKPINFILIKTSSSSVSVSG